MAESQKRQSTLFAFLPNQSTKESNKESSESSSSYGKKKGKVLAKQDYEKKRKRNFQEQWKSEFPWLGIAADESGAKMYCFYCRENEALADKSSPLFSGCGSDGNYRRDPLVSHNTSKCHLACAKAWQKNNQLDYQPPIKKAVQQMITSLDEKNRHHLRVLMNTAFFVGKEELAFRKFGSLCDLQEKNGVKMESMYRNEKMCSQFIASIADVEKEKTKREVRETRFLSLLSDGSTDAGIIEQETVFVRYVDKQGQPWTKFVDIVRLESATAAGVCNAITTGLETIDIDEETLKKKLVGCNFDGASVMMGKKSGVAVQIQKKVQQPVVILHCVAHNLELAVLDAVKTIPYLETFDETIRQVFKFYYYSPKKRREVNAVSEILDENPANFSSNIKKTRWLSSRHRALAAMEKNLAVTVTHLEQVSSGKGEDAAKAKGILKQITTGKFARFLYFMLDVTAVLKELSESFQRADLFITDVARKLDTAISNLELLKNDKPPTELSKFQTKFKSSYDEGKKILLNGKNNSQEVSLKDNSQSTDLRKLFSRFLTDTINYLEKRFASLSSPPLSDFTVFDYRNFPVQRGERASYGNEEVQRLVDYFAPLLSQEEKDGAVKEWQELKSFLATQRALKPNDVYASLLARNQNDLNNVLVLVKLMITISPTTATCERSFSAMNRLKTMLKTRMQQETLCNLLRVKDQGTVLKEFDPDSAIEQWLLKAKTKRHIVSKPNATSSAIHGDTNDGREVEQEQQEDDNMLLPPLPHLVVDEEEIE